MGQIIHADSYYTIGHHHIKEGLPCQDYATSLCDAKNKHPIILACVADGCSASPNSDLGSRILANWWKGYVSTINRGEDELLAPDEWLPDFMECARNATVFFLDNAMGDNEICMDATLNSIIYDTSTDWLHFHLFGDGYIFLKYQLGDGNFSYELGRAEWSAGMPPYLSYFLKPERKEQLILNSGRKGGEMKWELYGLKKDSEVFTAGQSLIKTSSESLILSATETIPLTVAEALDFQTPGFCFSTKAHEDDGRRIISATVFSDGLGDFHHTPYGVEPNVSLHTTLIRAHALTAFKNLEGDFVKRRVMTQMKTWSHIGFVPGDDFSQASIVFEES